MIRITYNIIKYWIDEWNKNNNLKIEIRVYNGYYHFVELETGTRICEGKVPVHVGKIGKYSAGVILGV